MNYVDSERSGVMGWATLSDATVLERTQFLSARATDLANDAAALTGALGSTRDPAKFAALARASAAMFTAAAAMAEAMAAMENSNG